MPRAKPLTVVTYNIHKGLSQFNRRLVLHEIRDRLKALRDGKAAAEPARPGRNRSRR